MNPDPQLIFDIGANEGEDTSFYLAKGFTVLAVEANPTIADRLRARFADDLTSGRLHLEDRAVANTDDSELNFYINRDNSHWSSLHESWGTRDSTSFDVITVRTVTLGTLLARFGCPYYLKIDVEGQDLNVLRALAASPARPPFVSVEEHDVALIDALTGMGYSSFALVNQRENGSLTNPLPALEGRYVDTVHSGLSSGLFGREVQAPWLAAADFREMYLAEIRAEDGRWISPDKLSWFDIHARYPTSDGSPPRGAV